MIGSGREKGSSSASGEQSWRELAGPRKTRINSPQARKRRRMQWTKLVGALAAFCLFCAVVVWAVLAFKNREEPIQIATPSNAIEQVIFDTDGALPDQWLGQVIQLKRGMTMMEIDIHRIKEQLEAEGQVMAASVERAFPASLKITVKEREPTLRMRLQDASGAIVDRIVARDGTLYKGIGYPRTVLATLPYVVPFRKPDGSVQPLQGVEMVAELIDLTRRTQPQFYKTWEVITLTHYSGDLDLPGQVIEVRSKMVPRIIFGLNSDFDQQLDRLAVILNYVQARGNPAIKRIDLSLLESAAVQFESGRIGTF